MTRTLVTKSRLHYITRSARGIGRVAWRSLETYGWTISAGYGLPVPPPREPHDQPGETP
jgi:hypothetical protein